MQTISDTHRAALLRDLQKLRDEIKELEENPPAHPDPAEAFRQVFRDGLEALSDEVETERPSS